MKLIIIVQTFFLVLAQHNDYYNFTGSTSDNLYDTQCTLMADNKVWSQLCNCASNNRRLSTDGDQTPMTMKCKRLCSSFLDEIKCEYIQKVTTSDPTSNHTGSTTINSVLPHSTTIQQELNTTDSTTSKLEYSCSDMLGATVVLAVLLILAIIGWVCTFVIVKKKGAANINKTYTRYYHTKKLWLFYDVFIKCSEIQTRSKNEYHNEVGNTQQESSEDQVQQDLNTEI